MNNGVCKTCSDTPGKLKFQLINSLITHSFVEADNLWRRETTLHTYSRFAQNLNSFKQKAFLQWFFSLLVFLSNWCWYTVLHFLFLAHQHHIKYQHLLKKKYVCPHPSCGRLFRLQKQLLRHAKHHTGTHAAHTQYMHRDRFLSDYFLL